MSSRLKVLVIGSPVNLVEGSLWLDISSRYETHLYEFPTTSDFHQSLQSGWCSDITAIVRLGINIPPGIEKVLQGWTKRALDYFPPSLKLIVNFGHGYDEEDVPGLERKEIRFLNTTAGSQATATVGVFLIIAAFRQLSRFERMLRNGEFLPGLRESARIAVDPFSKSLGIVGMGSIGQAVAQRAAALGMKIHCVKRASLLTSLEDETFRQTLPPLELHDDLASMAAKVDCVILTCSYSPATHHLLDEKFFQCIKPGGVIVNIARGKCIDDEALCAAIENKVVFGVGLDVHYDE